MTYDTIATVSQLVSMMIFISLAVAAVAYAMWPGNKQRFEEAQRDALDLGNEGQAKGGR
jgi:cbb3-type cytochrome oxidase subunit 3